MQVDPEISDRQDGLSWRPVSKEGQHDPRPTSKSRTTSAAQSHTRQSKSMQERSAYSVQSEKTTAETKAQEKAEKKARRKEEKKKARDERRKKRMEMLEQEYWYTDFDHEYGGETAFESYRWAAVLHAM